MAAKRPRVINPARPADQYHVPGERIIEFNSRFGGGLISFMEMPSSQTLLVQVYAYDHTVQVLTPFRKTTPDTEGDTP